MPLNFECQCILLKFTDVGTEQVSQNSIINFELKMATEISQNCAALQVWNQVCPVLCFMPHTRQCHNSQCTLSGIAPKLEISRCNEVLSLAVIAPLSKWVIFYDASYQNLRFLASYQDMLPRHSKIAAQMDVILTHFVWYFLGNWTHLNITSFPYELK